MGIFGMEVIFSMCALNERFQQNLPWHGGVYAF
jgi:hypothetical protein